MSQHDRGHRLFAAIAALTLVVSGTFAQNFVQVKPWYSSGLEKLGFTVFKEPQALDDFAVQAADGSPPD